MAGKKVVEEAEPLETIGGEIRELQLNIHGDKVTLLLLETIGDEVVLLLLVTINLVDKLWIVVTMELFRVEDRDGKGVLGVIRNIKRYLIFRQ